MAELMRRGGLTLCYVVNIARIIYRALGDWRCPSEETLSRAAAKSIEKDWQMGKMLLIDYENVQGIDLSEIAETDCQVSVFAGSTQSKIPIELVTSAQALGNQLKWIRIDGSGPNALDFHIAYYLGTYIAKNPRNEYFILSKDKGFDPLIRHLAKEKVNCKRITSVAEMTSTRRARNVDVDFERVLANLKKIEKSRRPRNETALRQHIKSAAGKFGSDEKVNQIVNKLTISKAIALENGRIVYKIDNITSR
jgi:PIN domain